MARWTRAAQAEPEQGRAAVQVFLTPTHLAIVMEYAKGGTCSTTPCGMGPTAAWRSPRRVGSSSSSSSAWTTATAGCADVVGGRLRCCGGWVLRHSPARLGSWGPCGVLAACSGRWWQPGRPCQPGLLLRHVMQLAMRAAASHSMPWVQARVSRWLLACMAQAHKAVPWLQGVANRDLKLENLLLDHDGEDGTRPLLKISDFGYSKVGGCWAEPLLGCPMLICSCLRACVMMSALKQISRL